MGKVVNRPKDPIQALYNEMDNVWTWIRNMSGNSISVDVRNDGTNPLVIADGDGDIWVDTDDNGLHYRVNGSEYVITGTLV